MKIYKKASMQKRRVTVHFGSVRVVVPWPEDETTVAELTAAAVLRYKKATGKIDADVRVARLECIRDGGILDPDDRVVDVFDETRDQILAIYDEQTANSSGMSSYQVISPIPSSSFNTSGISAPSPLMTSSPLPTKSSHSSVPASSSAYAITTSHLPNPPPYKPMTSSASMDFPSSNTRGPVPAYSRSPVVGRVKDGVVEINNLENPPSTGLRVSPPVSSLSTNATDEPLRSSLRSQTSTPSKHRVTLSPEVEKRLANVERDGRLARSSARKSRISDQFYEAKERLDDRSPAYLTPLSKPSSSKRQPLEMCPTDPLRTVITFADDQKTPLGINVEPIVDTNSRSHRVIALQIVRIDPDGRVGKDGRLAVEDKIVCIDGRPVHEMSVNRAVTYLRELEEKSAPKLTIDKPISNFDDEPHLNDRNESLSSSQRRPIYSALQQANTQAIGQKTEVNLQKSGVNGFGFTVTSRETHKGEWLLYVGSVKPNGVALGHLRIGDRILEINGESTTEMSQPDLVDRLRNAAVGETVHFVVSRMVQEEQKDSSESDAKERLPNGADDSHQKDESDRRETPIMKRHGSRSSTQSEMDEFDILVPLNDTASAGLGVSLKARVTVKGDKSRHDCGIFIKSVLHGGAADKDGRLQVDDRIVGIEELRLDHETNSAASEAIAKRLKAIGPNAHHVRLVIQRKRPVAPEDSEAQLGGSLTTPSPASLRCSQSSEGDRDKRSSMNSDSNSLNRLDESEIAPVNDPFAREAPSRRSISEKRGMGAANDPNHIKLFQDIKHQRQTSAPSASSSSSTQFNHGGARSASQRAAARARSASVHPRPVPTPEMKHLAISDAGPRRSMSMESINNTGIKQNGNSDYGTISNRSSGQSRSVERNPYAVYGGAPHPYPPGSPYIIQTRQATDASRDRQRRKSVGSVFKSLLGLNKEPSEENKEDLDRRNAQEHYERMQQRDIYGQRDPHRIYAEYEPAAIYAQLPPSPESPLILSNSRFYVSQRASTQHRSAIQSTTVTRPTDIQSQTPLSSAAGTSTPQLRRQQHTTLFPVQSPSQPHRVSPVQVTTVPVTIVGRGGEPTDVQRTTTTPTTTTCLTPGGRSAAAEVSVQLRSSRPHTEPRAVAVPVTPPDIGRDQQRRPRLPEPPSPRTPNPRNSTPLAFPTTRFVYANPSSSAFKSNTPERLSLRYRKKLRREVHSMADLPAPNPTPPLVRQETVIEEPALDYCAVWNKWNERSGSSLPARRPRPSRQRVAPSMYEAVTDC